MQALNDLQIKCCKSGFDVKLVRDMLEITRDWKDRFAPPKKKTEPIKSRIVWASCFPKLVKLSRREKQLNDDAAVVYKRPKTLSNQLVRYKRIAHETTASSPGSFPCNRCKLCGKFGKSNSMVQQTNSIATTKGKSFDIRKTLTCIDWGIYVATCTICSERYVGQTCTSFATRWSAHRSTWKHGTDDSGDKAALLKHYGKCHRAEANRELSSAFMVTFVDQPGDPCGLDVLESKWINRLEASINIQKTVLPRII